CPPPSGGRARCRRRGRCSPAPRYPARDCIELLPVLPNVAEAGAPQGLPPRRRRRSYGPHGVAPFNAASASRPRTTSSPLILVMSEQLLSRTGKPHERIPKRGSHLLSSGRASLTMSIQVIKFGICC